MIQETTTQQPAFKRSAETVALVDLLSKAEVGDTITYQAMNSAAEIDVQQNRGPLASAQRILRSERRFIFRPVRSVGVIRLANEEIIQTAPDRIKRVQRAAREGIKDLRCVDVSVLSDDQKLQHLNATAELGIVQLCCNSRTRGRIAQHVVTHREPPSLEQLSSLFKKE